MKISDVKYKLDTNEPIRVEMMRNPAKLNEWVVWIREPSGKSFLLTDEFDAVITNEDTNEFIFMLRNLGVKQVTVIF